MVVLFSFSPVFQRTPRRFTLWPNSTIEHSTRKDYGYERHRSETIGPHTKRNAWIVGEVQTINQDLCPFLVGRHQRGSLYRDGYALAVTVELRRIHALDLRDAALIFAAQLDAG